MYDDVILSWMAGVLVFGGITYVAVRFGVHHGKRDYDRHLEQQAAAKRRKESGS